MVVHLTVYHPVAEMLCTISDCYTCFSSSLVFTVHGPIPTLVTFMPLAYSIPPLSCL